MNSRSPDRDPDRSAERANMVRHQIAARGIRDPRVLEALREVPREAFVPLDIRTRAYEDGALPLSDGQTISQPYVVARMIELLRVELDDRVLEVGTGSGYAAAILGLLAREVHTVERIARLAVGAEEALEGVGATNVHVHVGDGSLGWPRAAPYEGIVVAAGGPRVPSSLLEQLAAGGRLVMPVEDGPGSQVLVVITRDEQGELRRTDAERVSFVPLLGEEGWPEG